MHPALSVIVFTTFSGAGYGLLAWLGAWAAAGWLPANRGLAATSLGLSLGAITVGLLSSTLHLGRPERAWRAFSQWRSSWLSREGVSSVATYAPALLFALGWLVIGSTSGVWAVFGALAAVGAVATVVCTAFIYRSLKPIQRWSNGWVLPNYLALSAMTGVLWMIAAMSLFGLADDYLVLAAFLCIPLASFLKVRYWRFIDRTASESDAGTATGLGVLGPVRLFEAPHTSENYLMKEMGFRIARKHSVKLRIIALIAAFFLPQLLTLAALLVPAALVPACAVAAAVIATVGVLVERWLFFAEAKHSVTLYYGAERT
ncbi:MAG TPA: DmsC/YnfH family molybdoenzyme membrane anchor subunit [Stellaceae bacterium]|nr:DmsC/YnfH family molybdoenzyme membrane anchor subunit [Stellaceae bacterium]